jgi:hypothetical protein
MTAVRALRVVALVVLVLATLDRLGWSWCSPLLMLTVGSSGAGFAVTATRT